MIGLVIFANFYEGGGAGVSGATPRIKRNIYCICIE